MQTIRQNDAFISTDWHTKVAMRLIIIVVVPIIVIPIIGKLIGKFSVKTIIEVVVEVNVKAGGERLRAFRFSTEGDVEKFVVGHKSEEFRILLTIFESTLKSG